MFHLDDSSLWFPLDDFPLHFAHLDDFWGHVLGRAAHRRHGQAAHVAPGEPKVCPGGDEGEGRSVWVCCGLCKDPAQATGRERPPMQAGRPQSARRAETEIRRQGGTGSVRHLCHACPPPPRMHSLTNRTRPLPLSPPLHFKVSHMLGPPPPPPLTRNLDVRNVALAHKQQVFKLQVAVHDAAANGVVQDRAREWLIDD